MRVQAPYRGLQDRKAPSRVTQNRISLTRPPAVATFTPSAGRPSFAATKAAATALAVLALRATGVR